MDLLLKSSAVFSPCGLYRLRLDREVQAEGITIVYCGVNGSTATGDAEDQTTMKWRGFTLRNGGRRYIAINPFGYRATDVKELAAVVDPVGDLNAFYVDQALAEADLIVPCWGNSSKVPARLRHHFAAMLDKMRATGKPIKVFGLTNSGDPKHPLMLGYDTRLIEFVPEPKP